MAFVSLADAMKRVGVEEAELKKMVQSKGIQVFMAGEGDQKGICFKEEDLASLSPSEEIVPEVVKADDDLDLDLGVDEVVPSEDRLGSSSSDHSDDEQLDLDLGGSEDSLDLDVGGMETLDLSAASNEDDGLESESDLDLDLSSDISDDGAASSVEDDVSLDEASAESPDDLNLSLDSDELDLSDGESDVDLDLDMSSDESLDLGMDDASDSPGFEMDETLAIGDGDDTLGSDDFSGDETLSFDDGDQTLSIGDDGDENLTLDFDGSDNLQLPDESFSVDGDDNTLNLGDGGVDLDDESGRLSMDEEEEEEESFRPTTEIIDEDSVGIIFPLVAFACFAIVVFNGCVMFGLIQDLGLDGSISYGKNFFATIRDTTHSYLPTLK
jgi:hypothetical protein